MKRILSALVALPILLFTIWSSTAYFFLVLAALACVLALWEFYGMAAKVGANSSRLTGCIAALLLLLCFMFGKLEFVSAILAATVIVTLCIELKETRSLATTLVSASATIFGVVYIGLLLAFLIGVRTIPDKPGAAHLGAKFLTTFFAIVMLTDTGAYCTGRLIGRHKLAPKISPGKTIEGAIGGFVTGILAGLACRLIFFGQLPVLDAALLGASVSAVGQAGDLVESMLKRGSGVKDSSNLIPGHGGMLDRLDSVLAAAPLIYYYSRFFLSRY